MKTSHIMISILSAIEGDLMIGHNYHEDCENPIYSITLSDNHNGWVINIYDSVETTSIIPISRDKTLEILSNELIKVDNAEQYWEEYLTPVMSSYAEELAWAKSYIKELADKL
jgi:hypothetical protein